ncbi:hypothetical protein [Bacteroides stercorirosoris]|uniref:hypothetical protein n=1 Tax=Bacteroides stercorirosoris TaxID=871324 RepID=UPI001FB155C3|nr:hypothetical protein [Bacteroides stercorirosoris]
MKKLLFLFLLVLCCACEEDKSVDPTLMPEATTTGQNTLGCLIDGWYILPGGLESRMSVLTMKTVTIMLRLVRMPVFSLLCILRL